MDTPQSRTIDLPGISTTSPLTHMQPPSAPRTARPRPLAFSHAQQCQIIASLFRGEDPKSIVQTHQISDRQLRRVTQNLREHGTFHAPSTKKMGRPSCLKQEVEEDLQMYITANPKALLVEMQKFLEQKYGVKCSKASLSRRLKGMNYTRTMVEPAPSESPLIQSPVQHQQQHQQEKIFQLSTETVGPGIDQNYGFATSVEEGKEPHERPKSTPSTGSYIWLQSKQTTEKSARLAQQSQSQQKSAVPKCRRRKGEMNQNASDKRNSRGRREKTVFRGGSCDNAIQNHVREGVQQTYFDPLPAIISTTSNNLAPEQLSALNNQHEPEHQAQTYESRAPALGTSVDNGADSDSCNFAPITPPPSCLSSYQQATSPPVATMS